MSGLEFLLPVLITHLVHAKKIPMIKVARLLSQGPIRLFQLPLKGLSLGTKPSFTVIDPKAEISLTADNLNSKGHNSPFLEAPLSGKINYTLVNGEILYKNTSHS